MLVRQHDRIQLERDAWRDDAQRANERARAGIDVDLRLPEAHPHPAGCPDLARDHEPRSTGTEETDRRGVGHQPM